MMKFVKVVKLTFSVVKLASGQNRLWVKTIVKTACDREEVEFMFVAATVLALFPSSIKLQMSS